MCSGGGTRDVLARTPGVAPDPAAAIRRRATRRRGPGERWNGAAATIESAGTPKSAGTGKSWCSAWTARPAPTRAREVAVASRAALGMPLVLVHGVAAPGGVGEEAGRGPRGDRGDSTTKVTGPAVAAAEAAGVRPSSQVVDDQPAQALVAAADAHDAEVIVVGIWNESPLRGAAARLRRRTSCCSCPAGRCCAFRRVRLNGGDAAGAWSYGGAVSDVTSVPDPAVQDPAVPDLAVPDLVVRGLRKTYKRHRCARCAGWTSWCTPGSSWP